MTYNQILAAIDKIRESQVRPDLEGNLRFRKKPDGPWIAFDERDDWLDGKPVGGTHA